MKNSTYLYTQQSKITITRMLVFKCSHECDVFILDCVRVQFPVPDAYFGM